MAKQAAPSIEDIEQLQLGLVVLLDRSERALRFRVTDPLIDPAYTPFDLVFGEPASFLGEGEMEGVRLRILDAPDRRHRLYEFVADEIVPTEGRPYQAEILTDGQQHVLFGDRVQKVKARVEAETLTVVAAVDGSG